MAVSLFNLCGEHSMRNAGLDDLQAGIKLGGRNINTRRYMDDNTLMAERRGTEELLVESEGREWGSWLKTEYEEKQNKTKQN